MSLSVVLDAIWTMFAYSLLFIVFMFCIAAVIGCFKGLVNLFISEDELTEVKEVESSGLKSVPTAESK
jgi:hypothetical protein